MKEEMDRIAIITLGCKVNQAESEELAGALAARGYLVSRELDRASICVINTCTVTSEGDHKSRKAVAKALRAGIPVIATGCTVETAPGSLGESENLQLVTNDLKHRIPQLIEERQLRRGRAGDAETLLRSRAAIKIQDGCDGACSYCIVPAARGRSRSLPRTAIDAAVEAATRRGAAELVLTGVNLGDFGMDNDSSLTDLVRELTGRGDVGRIRLSSLELEHLRDDLLAEVRDNPKVCKHLHLPLQSGDAKILKAMRRSYTPREVIEKLAGLRSSVRELAVTLDILVGFPGEGEGEFQNTLEVIRELAPAKLHVFPYSPRPGTEAASLPHQVDQRVKRERAWRARQLGSELQRRFVEAQVGTLAEIAVLASGREGETTGLTGNYVRVMVDHGGQKLSGGLEMVNIRGARGFTALAVPANEAGGS